MLVRLVPKVPFCVRVPPILKILEANSTEGRGRYLVSSHRGLEIRHYLSDCWIDMLGARNIGRSTEDQNDAFETLLAEIRNGNQSQDTNVMSSQSVKNGPRRLEAVLQKRGCTDRDSVVVISVLEPSAGYSYYTIRGRKWLPSAHLSGVETLYDSSNWDILELREFDANSASSITNFYRGHSTEHAYNSINSKFKKLRRSEIKVIAGWSGTKPSINTLAEDEDLNDIYGAHIPGAHYNYSAGYYSNVNKPTAVFRVKGDDKCREDYEAYEKALQEPNSCAEVPSIEVEANIRSEESVEKKSEVEEGKGQETSSTNSTSPVTSSDTLQIRGEGARGISEEVEHLDELSRALGGYRGLGLEDFLH